MKKSIFIALSTLALSPAVLHAQEKTTETTIVTKEKNGDVEMYVIENKDNQDTSKKNSTYISIGSNGIRVSDKKKEAAYKKKRFQVQWGMLDLGLNMLNDQTTYNVADPALMNNFANIPADQVNGDLFSIRNGRSWNVNIYPVMFNYKMVSQKNFKINLYTGIGLQIYNFRFDKNITFQSDPNYKIKMDDVAFTKNKMSVQYLTVPLMLNFNHRVDKSNWITYGFGASFGYRLSSWTKQISGERGKVKNNDQFNFSDYNVNLNAEIGFGEVRFYGSYQLTNLYRDASITHQPISFGIRFGGI